MHSVADELDICPRRERRADKAGLPVVEGLHAVEEMCHVSRARLKPGHGLIVVRGAVAEGHGTDLRRLADKVQLDLRGDGYKAHYPSAQLVELVKERDVRL